MGADRACEGKPCSVLSTHAAPHTLAVPTAPARPSQLSTGAANNPGWTGGSSILAELGTLQVEFRYLGAATHEPAFARKAEAVIERMDALHPADGLYPIYVSADSGQPSTSHVTFGALGDSFYEYLLKVWLQGGRAEPMYRRMYDTAMAGMESKLLQHSRPSGLAYVADWNGANVEHKVRRRRPRARGRAPLRQCRDRPFAAGPPSAP